MVSIHRIGANPSTTTVTMWTTMNTTASSETLRWIRCSTNRGVAGGDQRTTFRMPRTVTAVSNNSETAPVPRARYQTACEDVTAITQTARSGQPPTLVDVAVGSNQACGKGARREPARCVLTEHDRSGRRRVRINAGTRGDGDRPPNLASGKARPRIHDVMHGSAAARPPPDGRARRRQAAGVDADGLARLWIAVVVVGDPDQPSTLRYAACHRDVSAQAHEYAAADDVGGACGGAVGGERLRGRTEIQPDTTRHSDLRPVAADLDLAPSGRDEPRHLGGEGRTI